MPAKTQCKAITKSGLRCINHAKLAGLCGVHLPRSSKSPLKERAKSLKEAALAAGAIAALVEGLVKLWQSLPFGPGPAMPSDYEYLQDQLEFSWNTERGEYVPGNRSGETVNWRLARTIYDRANSIVESSSLSAPEPEISSLATDLELLFDSLPTDLQQMLYKKLGADSSDPTGA